MSFTITTDMRPSLLGLFLSLFTFHFALSTFSQTLLVPATGSPQQPHFNPAFMARNNVAEVKGQLHVKRDGEPMVPKNEHYWYRFDSNGLAWYSNNSFGRPGSGRDTASIGYRYDGQGNLLQRTRLDLSGHYSEEFELDSLGRPVRETHVRIENLGTDRYTLVPGTRTEVSDEHFRYDALNDSTKRITYLNSLGLPYREELHISDRLGYLRAIEDRYLVSNRMGRTTFTYNEKGLLASRTEQSDLSVPRTVRYSYTYDAADNLLGMDTWQNDKHVTKEEYVYAEGSLHLKAKLTKDMATGTIRVVRYEVIKR
ncbi:MAG: hypothetical protein IPG74_08580 [Flavobacteriales bacterium]|nr:hypothetical protein [Flavobacteriales bacterium]